MLFSSTESAFATAVSKVAYANPFDDDAQRAARRELSEIDLGLSEHQRQRPPVDSPRDPFPEVYARRTEALLLVLHERMRASSALAPRELERLEDLIIMALYLRYFAPADPLPALGRQGNHGIDFRAFSNDLRRWTSLPLSFTSFLARPEHTFAIFFQYRLASALLNTLLQGASRPMAQLRAATWHSIFPRELRLYGVLLYKRMHEVTTLILGPSGTGKELVASAIGLARFVAFDPKRERFTEPFSEAFHAINLSAMPRDLIESEMFGHVSGAFTGATKDRAGWFETCRRGHTVFLDELGELAEPVQVRLLRVLQNREFYRIGETEPKLFEGRVSAATNRDLSALIDAGQFREDLYFRLCSDQIRTPTLRSQLDDAPNELANLVTYAAGRCLGADAPDEFVEQLTSATLHWIEGSPSLGLSYTWPGNFRELEQCVRSVMVRGEYHPPARNRRDELPSQQATESGAMADFLAQVRAGSLTMDELLVRYCSLIHSRTENVAETARRLKKHRVTVQGRIDSEWVERFRKR